MCPSIDCVFQGANEATESKEKKWDYFWCSYYRLVQISNELIAIMDILHKSEEINMWIYIVHIQNKCIYVCYMQHSICVYPASVPCFFHGNA